MSALRLVPARLALARWPLGRCHHVAGVAINRPPARSVSTKQMARDIALSVGKTGTDGKHLPARPPWKKDETQAGQLEVWGLDEGVMSKKRFKRGSRNPSKRQKPNFKPRPLTTSDPGGLANLAFTWEYHTRRDRGWKDRHGVYFPEQAVPAMDRLLETLDGLMASACEVDAVPEYSRSRYKPKAVRPETHTPAEYMDWPVVWTKFQLPMLSFKVKVKGRGRTIAEATSASLAGIFAHPESRPQLAKIERCTRAVTEKPPPAQLLDDVYRSAMRLGCLPIFSFSHPREVDPELDDGTNDPGVVLRYNTNNHKARWERPIQITVEAPRLGIRVTAMESIDEACQAFLKELGRHSQHAVQQTGPDSPQRLMEEVTPDNAKSILETKYPGDDFKVRVVYTDRTLRRMGVQLVQVGRNYRHFSPEILTVAPKNPAKKGIKRKPTLNFTEDQEKLAYQIAVLNPKLTLSPLTAKVLVDLDTSKLMKPKGEHLDLEQPVFRQ